MQNHEPNNQSFCLYKVSLSQVFHYSTEKDLMFMFNFMVSEYKSCSNKYMPGLTAILLL